MKVKPGEKCFNYGKKSHYTKDYCSTISNKKKLKKSMQEANAFNRKDIKPKLLGQQTIIKKTPIMDHT